MYAYMRTVRRRADARHCRAYVYRVYAYMLTHTPSVTCMPTCTEWMYDSSWHVGICDSSYMHADVY